MLKTRLTREWGLQFPLIQAPMAGVAGGELAAASSRAGALGMIGVGAESSGGWIAEESVKARAGGRTGAGLMAWAVERRPELLDTVLQQKPAAVAISFGDIAPYAELVRSSGAKLLAQVQDAETARAALDAGVDALVAQGTEAGGHTGRVGTLPLLQVVLELAGPHGVPVIAAGGVASGRAIAAALAMGCDGVWIGTPFIATPESTSSEAARARVLRAAETDTVLTHVFDILQEAPWPDQFAGRALTNSLAERWHGREEELVARLPEVQEEFRAARRQEDYSAAHIYAGQSSGLVREVLPAEQLIRRLMSEAEDVLRASFRELLGDS